MAMVVVAGPLSKPTERSVGFAPDKDGTAIAEMVRASLGD